MTNKNKEIIDKVREYKTQFVFQEWQLEKAINLTKKELIEEFKNKLDLWDDEWKSNSYPDSLIEYIKQQLSQLGDK